jgi:hypothetical protein
MKKTITRLLPLTVFLCSILALPQMAMALGKDDVWDSPHDATNSMDCGDCHQVRGASYPKMVASLCQSCHFDSGPATGVKTHSSKTAGDGYGNWDLDCWSCHNPHTQEQDIAWGSSYGKLIKKDFLNLSIKEINPADPGPYYAPLSTLRSVTSDMLEFKGNTEFVDGDGLTANDICQVCHENTSNFSSGVVDNHTDYGPDSQTGGNCTATCHLHSNGFRPSGTGKAHDTHLNALYGPQMDCDGCHGSHSSPMLADGNDLATTTACDACHSPDGAFDGVDDPVMGARNNWPDGVYTGNDLTAGKEQWCVSCHDLGTSVIPASGGRQAPDVAGDNINYGYYQAGHGAFATECGDCHDFSLNHNFDGQKTYTHAGNNYRLGYRLKQIGGQEPMIIPSTTNTCVTSYSADNYRLCYTCHDEKTLIQDVKWQGVFECTNNPYNITNDPTVTAITTQFRNEFVYALTGALPAEDVPANIHWDHLVDVNTFGKHWYSDDIGLLTANVSCPTCHNVHGDSSGGIATLKMMHYDYELSSVTAAYGEYGKFGPYADPTDTYKTNRCDTACHSAEATYYRVLNQTIKISLTQDVTSISEEAGESVVYSVVLDAVPNGSNIVNVTIAELAGGANDADLTAAFNITVANAASATPGVSYAAGVLSFDFNFRDTGSRKFQVPGTLSFTLTAQDDAIVEGTETLEVQLSGASINNGTATITGPVQVDTNITETD